MYGTKSEYFIDPQGEIGYMGICKRLREVWNNNEDIHHFLNSENVSAKVITP